MVESVPDERCVGRLDVINLLSEMAVEAPEVNQLADGIDFRLEDGLGMRQHGSGVHDVPIRSGDEISRFQENGGTLFPRHVCPGALSLDRRLHRHSDFFLTSLVIVPQHLGVIVRRADFHFGVGFDFFSVDDHGDFKRGTFQFRQRFFQLGTFRGTGSVVENRFVFGGWYAIHSFYSSSPSGMVA